MPQTVSVIVIAHNEEAYIEECLHSLCTQTQKPDEILVIAHNCTDATEAIVQEKYPEVILISYQGPIGSIYARIQGFARASYPILACLDGDSRVDENWLSALTAPLADPEISAVSNPTLFSGNAFVWLASRFYYYGVYGKWYWFLRLFPRVRDVTFWGTSFACRKVDIERIGGLQPLVYMQNHPGTEWYDDYYLSLKLKEVGSIAFTYETVVHTASKQQSSYASLRRFFAQRTGERKIRDWVRPRYPRQYAAVVRK